MASVLDRPMFNTEARDRLKDIGGIPRVLPLATPAKSPSYLDLVEKAGRGETITYEDYSRFASGENVSNQQALDVLAMVEQPGYVPSDVEVGVANRPNLNRTPDVPSDPAIGSGLRAVGNYFGDVFGGTTLGEAEKRRVDEETAKTKFDEYTAAGGFDAALQQLREDDAALFGTLDRAADNVNPRVTNMEMEARLSRPKTPFGMEAEARKISAQDPQAAEAVSPVAPTGKTTMEADARGRKPMAITPADVAAGLNDPTPEVREKTAADFAKQFTDMGPKYEGIDKGLLLAQIGFAIAAGESPNAMKNIADGLSLGADTAIKDKAAKAEFDRQIQLSAMQYGLGEAGKLETEKRAMAREGKNGTHYVADRDITLNGRKYTAGQSVFLPNSMLWETGVPEGLVTESMADSVSKNRAALEVALEKAKADKAISVSDFTKLSTELNDAADSLESTRALRPLLEASIIRAADGTVTGVNASLTKWVNDGASAIGIDLGKSYEDPAQFQADMLNVSNQLIQEILRETGRNISVSDRKIVADMVGQINNDYDRISTDPNILLGSLQNVLKVIDKNEQAAIDQYTTITRNTAGLLSPSGGELNLSDRASRVFQDTAPVDMNELFSYDKATGVWNLIGGQ